MDSLLGSRFILRVSPRAANNAPNANQHATFQVNALDERPEPAAMRGSVLQRADGLPASQKTHPARRRRIRAGGTTLASTRNDMLKQLARNNWQTAREPGTAVRRQTNDRPTRGFIRHGALFNRSLISGITATAAAGSLSAKSPMRSGRSEDLEKLPQKG
jgi:hypothetical protein